MLRRVRIYLVSITRSYRYQDGPCNLQNTYATSFGQENRIATNAELRSYDFKTDSGPVAINSGRISLANNSPCILGATCRLILDFWIALSKRLTLETPLCSPEDDRNDDGIDFVVRGKGNGEVSDHVGVTKLWQWLLLQIATKLGSTTFAVAPFSFGSCALDEMAHPGHSKLLPTNAAPQRCRLTKDLLLLFVKIMLYSIPWAPPHLTSC